jgi:hypothetical protein
MSSSIRLERLNVQNFEAFTSFVNCENGGCYCAFWHQNFTSMDEWEKRKSTEPELNQSCMLERVRSGLHLGVLAYQGRELVAWISVGPAKDFYWAWRRVGQLGESAKAVAVIPCITRKTEVRDRVTESALLSALRSYGKEQGWTAIEGYPFERETIDRLGETVAWPGFPEAFTEAGFQSIGKHWLNSEEYGRSIYRAELC